MVRSAKAAVVAAASLLALCAGATMSRAACPLQADFDRAVQAKSMEQVEALNRKMMKTSACSADERAAARDRKYELQIALWEAGSLPPEELDAKLEGLMHDNGSWYAGQKLGDRAFDRASAISNDPKARLALFKKSLQYYEAAIDGATGDAARLSDAQKAALIKKAGAAKILASNAGGVQQAMLAPSSRRSDGSIGGIFGLRGAVAIPVPLPINFETGTTEFTQTGQQAAQELAKALAEENPPSITLVGHTDERGTPSYNMALSQRRAEKVRDFLAQQGIHTDVKIVAKGSTDPFDPSVLPSEPSQEEKWSLDRRVELVR